MGVFCLASAVAHGQTATNSCTPTPGNAYSVSLGSTCTWQSFDKPAAFTTAYEPNSCSSRNGTTSYGDAWGWFTALHAITTITFDPDNNHRPILHVFTGTCGGALTEIACNNAGSNGANATVTINATPGQVYLVRVQRHQSNADMNGSLCILSPRSTNACALNAANQFTVGTDCQFQTFNKPDAYSATMNPGTCNSGNYDDGWGWFTATDVQTVITFDPDANVRPILHVFSGTCGSLVQVGCHDAGANGVNAELAITTVPGQNYIFRIQRQNNNAAMDGGVCIWTPNTTNACALIAQNQFSVTPNCVFQTFEKPEAYTANTNPGGCNSGNYDDSWGWFTATSLSTSIVFDPDASMRPILHLFTGTCGSLTQVACYDAGGNGNNAQLVVPTVIGQNYIFRVQRHNNSGAMDGGVCITAIVGFDDCMQAQLLPVPTSCFMQTFSNNPATRSPQTPDPSCGGTINNSNLLDVWFTFTAPPGGQVMIQTHAGTMTNGAMQLYSGTCGSMTAIECDDDDGPGDMPQIDRMCNPLIAGQTYLIRLWGRNGQQGSFGICVTSPGTYQPAPEDCSGSLLVCSDQNINNNALTSGCTQDLNNGNRGCLVSNERQGSWYYFSPSASGTIEFTITPNGNVDYDFAIWGPLTNFACPPAATPVRCSYAWPNGMAGYPAAHTFLTGMRAGNTDTSEPSTGTGVNGFVAPMNVVAGQVYILYVDNFSTSGQSFTLDWDLTNGCSLDCTVLPVEIFAFEAVPRSRHVELAWTAASGSDGDHFVVEHSVDALSFADAVHVPGTGQSANTVTYHAVHGSPANGVNYYRLKQIAADGSATYSSIVPVIFRSGDHVLVPRPNPATSTVQVDLPPDLSGAYSLSIADATGRMIRVAGGVAGEGPGFVDIAVAHLDAGSYTLVLHTDHDRRAGVGRFVRE